MQPQAVFPANRVWSPCWPCPHVCFSFGLWALSATKCSICSNQSMLVSSWLRIIGPQLLSSLFLSCHHISPGLAAVACHFLLLILRLGGLGRCDESELWRCAAQSLESAFRRARAFVAQTPCHRLFSWQLVFLGRLPFCRRGAQSSLIYPAVFFVLAWSLPCLSWQERTLCRLAFALLVLSYEFSIFRTVLAQPTFIPTSSWDLTHLAGDAFEIYSAQDCCWTCLSRQLLKPYSSPIWFHLMARPPACLAKPVWAAARWQKCIYCCGSRASSFLLQVCSLWTNSSSSPFQLSPRPWRGPWDTCRK